MCATELSRSSLSSARPFWSSTAVIAVAEGDRGADVLGLTLGLVAPVAELPAGLSGRISAGAG